MAKNTIEVDVKFTERLERARELFNKSIDEGVYKGVKGQEAKNKVASSINALDALFKSLKSVDEKDLKIEPISLVREYEIFMYFLLLLFFIYLI